MSDSFSQAAVAMSTRVTIEVVGRAAREGDALETIVSRALAWFHAVEACCTRFDPSSELMQLVSHPGQPVDVSPMLAEAVRFALRLAECTGGAFDPTVGQRMEAHGFNREYRTGALVHTPVASGEDVTYLDVRVEPDRPVITLRRPLVLDLGGVAKGLAIDLAARELVAFPNIAIDAGGDLYLRGRNASGAKWSVGVRHPRRDDMIEVVRVSDAAVCTSGDYERRVPSAAGDRHHIIDPRTGASVHGVTSATVIAPAAMLADGLATAAFVLGADEGISLCQRLGVQALIMSSDWHRVSTKGWPGE